jgi:hypothetical protein
MQTGQYLTILGFLGFPLLCLPMPIYAYAASPTTLQALTAAALREPVDGLTLQGLSIYFGLHCLGLGLVIIGSNVIGSGR